MREIASRPLVHAQCVLRKFIDKMKTKDDEMKENSWIETTIKMKETDHVSSVHI